MKRKYRATFSQPIKTKINIVKEVCNAGRA
jgi:hypothetical protein